MTHDNAAHTPSDPESVKSAYINRWWKMGGVFGAVCGTVYVFVHQLHLIRPAGDIHRYLWLGVIGLAYVVCAMIGGAIGEVLGGMKARALRREQEHAKQVDGEPQAEEFQV